MICDAKPDKYAFTAGGFGGTGNGKTPFEKIAALSSSCLKRRKLLAAAAPCVGVEASCNPSKIAAFLVSCKATFLQVVSGSCFFRYVCGGESCCNLMKHTTTQTSHCGLERLGVVRGRTLISLGLLGSFREVRLTIFKELPTLPAHVPVKSKASANRATLQVFFVF